jgi:hypothetical protein
LSPQTHLLYDSVDATWYDILSPRCCGLSKNQIL